MDTFEYFAHAANNSTTFTVHWQLETRCWVWKRFKLLLKSFGTLRVRGYNVVIIHVRQGSTQYVHLSNDT